MSVKLESIGLTITKDKPKLNSVELVIPENQWVQENIKPSVEDAQIGYGYPDLPEIDDIQVNSGMAEVIDVFGISGIYRTRNALRASDIKPINIVSVPDYGIFSKIKIVLLSYGEYSTTMNVVLDGSNYITLDISTNETKYEIDMELDEGKHTISFVSEAYIGNLTIYAR